jgi:hypothetical protein
VSEIERLLQEILDKVTSLEGLVAEQNVIMDPEEVDEEEEPWR